jgi:hypothetical protein
MTTKVTWEMLNPDRATQGEAEAGSSNDKFITPLRAYQASQLLKWRVAPKRTAPAGGLVNALSKVESERKIFGIDANGIAFDTLDGITWNIRGDTAFSGNTHRTKYSENLGYYVAVGIDAASDLKYSTDLITWNSPPLNVGSIHALEINDVLPRFVTGTNGGDFYYSDNGTTWNAGTSSVYGVVWDIVYRHTPTPLYVGGADAGRIWTSTDGITWSEALRFSSAVLSVTYSDDLGLFIAGTDNNKIGYSSDGASWTIIDGPFPSSPAAAKQIEALEYSSGLKIIVATNGYGQIAYSKDAVNWYALPFDKLGTDLIKALVVPDFLDQIIVASGSQDKIVFSV